MLDVHLLTIPGRDASRTIESFLIAQKRSPFPVTLNIVLGEVGHIGRGRMIGYACGDYPYVTSIDDDDWLEPNAFCIPMFYAFMRSHVPAIYTHFYTWQNGKRVISKNRQNFRIFRRDVAMSVDLSDWPTLDSVPMIAAADELGEGVILPHAAYNYVIDEHSASRRLITQALNDKAAALRKTCRG